MDKYTEQQLVTACNLIKEGTMTYGQAFRKFKIPKSTLFKKCKDVVVTIQKPNKLIFVYYDVIYVHKLVNPINC